MPAEGKTNKTIGNGTLAPGRLEADLWKTADALRGSMDAAEYKHVVLELAPIGHGRREGLPSQR